MEEDTSVRAVLLRALIDLSGDRLNPAAVSACKSIARFNAKDDRLGFRSLGSGYRVVQGVG